MSQQVFIGLYPSSQILYDTLSALSQEEFFQLSKEVASWHHHIQEDIALLYVSSATHEAEMHKKI